MSCVSRILCCFPCFSQTNNTPATSAPAVNPNNVHPPTRSSTNTRVTTIYIASGQQTNQAQSSTGSTTRFEAKQNTNQSLQTENRDIKTLSIDEMRQIFIAGGLASPSQ